MNNSSAQKNTESGLNILWRQAALEPIWQLSKSFKYLDFSFSVTQSWPCWLLSLSSPSWSQNSSSSSKHHMLMQELRWQGFRWGCAPHTPLSPIEVNSYTSFPCPSLPKAIWGKGKWEEMKQLAETMIPALGLGMWLPVQEERSLGSVPQACNNSFSWGLRQWKGKFKSSLHNVSKCCFRN